MYINNKSNKILAINLRKEGNSYSYIQEKTGVSKSTLSHWLADVPYTPNNKTIKRIGVARAKSGEVKAKIKKESIEEATKTAKKDVGVLSKRDLFMLGLGIYVGEGTKSHGIVRVINSDPDVINTMLAWFKKAFGLKNTNFSIRLHLYPDNDEKESLSYWSKTTGLPLKQFQKTQVDLRKKKSSKRGKLPYGTAHVTVKGKGKKEHGIFLSRRINACMKEVHRKAGLV